MQETWVQALGWEDPLEKGMATHSSILAWRMPRTVYSPWGRKELDTSEQLSLSLIFIYGSASVDLTNHTLHHVVLQYLLLKKIHI